MPHRLHTLTQHATSLLKVTAPPCAFCCPLQIALFFTLAHGHAGGLVQFRRVRERKAANSPEALTVVGSTMAGVNTIGYLALHTQPGGEATHFSDSADPADRRP